MADEKKSSDKVMVCLNCAHDLIYQLSDGSEVRLNGAAHGITEGALPVGKFGMTMVATKDWEVLQKMYGKTERFKNGLIFAATDKASAMEEAEEKADLRHGLEPIDTTKTKTKKADD